jgi:hypothetical protein
MEVMKMNMFNEYDWKNFDLQMFAEDGDNGGAEPDTPEKQPNEPGNDPKTAAKYTDDDVNKIIEKKFAEWQKKQEKKVSEAERLSKMTAEEKAAEKLKALEDKIHSYEMAAARTEMTKQARAILSDKNIHIDDVLLTNLIAEDAETTKASVESFISLFTAAVEKAVKEKVKGDTPKTGTTSGLTREQILAIPNRAERQRLMKENKNLF